MTTKVLIPPAGSSGVSTLPNPDANAMATFLASKVPTLVDFEYLRAQYYPLGAGVGAFTPTDGLGAGGAGSAAAGGVANVYAGSVVQQAKTVVFGIAVRIKFQTPTAGKISRFGLLTSAGTARITFGCAHATSATNYFRQVEGTTADTGVAYSAGYHDCAITSDATNITFWVDGASAGSIACTALTADEALHFFVSNTDGITTVFTRFVWGGISP
jgi:hypothetical protein